MITGSVAVRYAKSLYSLAKEKKVQDTIKEDALFIKQSLEQISELEDILSMPTIKGSKKLSAFKAIFEGKVHELTLGFIDMVFKNNREEALKNMTIQFLNIYKKEQGIKSVTFTTATKLDNTFIKEIEEIIANQFQSKIEMETKVDNDIIGGFVLQIEDRQYNASVKTKLQQLRQNIIS